MITFSPAGAAYNTYKSWSFLFNLGKQVINFNNLPGDTFLEKFYVFDEMFGQSYAQNRGKARADMTINMIDMTLKAAVITQVGR